MWDAFEHEYLPEDAGIRLLSHEITHRRQRRDNGDGPAPGRRRARSRSSASATARSTRSWSACARSSASSSTSSTTASTPSAPVPTPRRSPTSRRSTPTAHPVGRRHPPEHRHRIAAGRPVGRRTLPPRRPGPLTTCFALRSASLPAGAFGIRVSPLERLRSAPTRLSVELDGAEAAQLRQVVAGVDQAHGAGLRAHDERLGASAPRAS